MPPDTKSELVETSKVETEGSSCSSSNGACFTNTRMCPGFALLGGWLISYPIYYFTGSRNISLVAMFTVAILLMTGMHTKIWRTLKNKRS